MKKNIKLSLLFWFILLLQFVLQMFLFSSLTTVVAFFPVIALSIGGFFLVRIQKKSFWNFLLGLNILTFVLLVIFSFTHKYFLWDIFCPSNPDLILKCLPSVVLYVPVQLCFHGIFWLTTLFVLKDLKLLHRDGMKLHWNIVVPYLPFIAFWIFYALMLFIVGKPSI